ncbi:MAG: cytochrome o ubiquinol oxidase subunit IV [Chlamydiales bacterium]
MKEPQHIPHQPQWGGHVSTQSYALGYVASLFLTLAAFLIVGQKLLSGWLLGVTLFALALAQSWIQLAYYFHLGKEPKPRWNLLAFYFMLFILVIVVIGSLLIMKSLNYRMAS